MKAAKLTIESFCRVKKTKSVHLQIDNVTALPHLVKMGGNFEENLGVLNCEQDHTYCRIPPKLSKHSGGLGVTPYQGLKRVEIVSSDICKDNSDNGKTKCRLFCVTPFTSTPMVHVMETGPFLHGSGCPATQNGHICSPMLFPHFL